MPMINSLILIGHVTHVFEHLGVVNACYRFSSLIPLIYNLAEIRKAQST